MFKTLNDYKKDDKDDKKKKKGYEAYSGGEKSGMAVEHPEEVNQLIERAK